MSTCRDFNTVSFLARAGGGRKPGNVRYWPLADILSCTAHVRFGGKADMPFSQLYWLF